MATGWCKETPEELQEYINESDNFFICDNSMHDICIKEGFCSHSIYFDKESKTYFPQEPNQTLKDCHNQLLMCKQIEISYPKEIL